ncbi:DNA double-strand break repair nuclease NurA [Acidianus ambivalens]|uniref:Nuclease NurA n=1 Tax=Acidianus ambivalens TaxID=2283 RepID=A0A6G1T7M0_ACIAM|nr:DNA double-strand break repair nuclease NurA [Acidianus ambivalens]MQL56594.1 nuclease NurA [Acidianus ambivalens]
MEFGEAIKSLFSLLTSLDQPYLGVTPALSIEDSTPVEVEDELGECESLTTFSFLDSSSRMISVKGANIYFASLYANLVTEHLMIPLKVEVPFMAIKASEEVRKLIEGDQTLSKIVAVNNVNGEPYSPDYKDDNILDELRISLENYAISKSNFVTIVDGPIIPGPYIQMVGEPYRSAFISLANQRKKDKLIGIVKRLNYSRKLRRSELVKDPRLMNATDDIIVEYLGRGKEFYTTPVLKEEIDIGNSHYTRYMVYVKVREGVFRVESLSKDLLCKGVYTARKYSSYRGIPEFIEVADRISKRLSASAFIFAFNIARVTTGVNYEDWESLRTAELDASE